MTGQYSKLRLGSICIFFIMAFVLFFARLVYIQVVRGDELREKAKRQYLQAIEIPAKRGDVYDAKGYKLAVNSSFQSLFAYPLTDADVDQAYIQLSRIFGEKIRDLKRKYRLTPKKFRWIKRGMSPDDLSAFAACRDTCGLFLREEPTRIYPYGDVGRGILGFVDIDNRGKSGIELVMDEQLMGVSGRSLIQKDARGGEYRIQEIPLQAAEPGNSVVLTVDWDKQQIVEEELAKAVALYKAKAGMAVFIDPFTGAILAAADCSADTTPSDKPPKLNAVASVYEPGSIFKLITAAAALDGGQVKEQDRFFAENGIWHMGAHSLRDDHKYGWITFREAFEFSSNIAMGKIANEIGGDKVFAMAQRLGFGRLTRCGLNSESKGVLKPPQRWSKFITSTFAIGHGMSVTPLQMAQAFAVVASGGYLSQPHFIEACISHDGQVIKQNTSRPIKILDKNVVAMLDSFMRGVIERGTGKPLKGGPFAIAGKTGTAEKPNLETGGYNKNKYMASFAGYFPADSPCVAGIVVLDEPEPIHYGGYTAGPAFKNIAIKFAALDGYNLPPYIDTTQADTAAAAPDTVVVDTIPRIQIPQLAGMSRTAAILQLSQLGLGITFSGAGDTIVSTRPTAFAALPAGQPVHCYLAEGKESMTAVAVPDVKGLTIREAVSLLTRYGLPFTCRGQGKVVRQTPEAETNLAPGSVIELEFDRSEGIGSPQVADSAQGV
jgi:cell division protein FtsI/penicillin-binding protein 2